MSLSASPPPLPYPPAACRRLSASLGPATGVKVVTRKVIRTLEGLRNGKRSQEEPVVNTSTSACSPTQPRFLVLSCPISCSLAYALGHR
ncbi:hypothetical protein B0H12DRAFT_1145842 [Mycena haematopus]|nr:hypothetical protein B0H12DRAFT_1145842 [Mycena haematopus]